MQKTFKEIFSEVILIERPKAKLIRIERLTSGGGHAWVDSDQGLIRKPLASIPKDMRDEFMHSERRWSV